MALGRTQQTESYTPKGDSVSLLLSVPEVARHLRVSTKTIWNLIGDGSLVTIRVGRRVLVRDSDLTSFIEARVERRQPKAKVA
jgi:excisionase family DNA binding protein